MESTPILGPTNTLVRSVRLYTADGIGVEFCETPGHDCIMVTLLAGGEQRTTLVAKKEFSNMVRLLTLFE